MDRRPYWLRGLLAIVSLVVLSACHSQTQTIKGKGGPEMQVHYIEIVSKNVDKQCNALEQVHGLSFGPEVQDLGRAKVAKNANGVLIGVRAPLAEHEQTIVRVYVAVDDITKAVKAVESAGAVIAYPPTKQGETGTWAIYILDGVQHGLWQQ